MAEVKEEEALEAISESQESLTFGTSSFQILIVSIAEDDPRPEFVWTQTALSRA
jgi:hypothetical protein